MDQDKTTTADRASRLDQLVGRLRSWVGGMTEAGLMLDAAREIERLRDESGMSAHARAMVGELIGMIDEHDQLATGHHPRDWSAWLRKARALLAAPNNAIADKTGLPKTAIDAVLNAQADVATAELYIDGEVTLPGLGKLTVKVRAARDGRNPRTGETVHIPVKRAPHFGASKALKDAVATTI